MTEDLRERLRLISAQICGSIGRSTNEQLNETSNRSSEELGRYINHNVDSNRSSEELGRYVYSHKYRLRHVWHGRDNSEIIEREFASDPKLLSVLSLQERERLRRLYPVESAQAAAKN